MLKALEILNLYHTHGEDIMFMPFKKCYVNEAIAELEALENKSCDGCKHYLSDNGNFPLEPCGECSRFYADKLERKEDEN